MILRVLAALAVLLLAAACAVVEVLYLPLRSGLVPIPLSVLAAAVLNVLFTRMMYVLTGSILAALLPGAVWLAVVARSAIARPEGDLLITDGGSSTGLAVVNLAFLILGALALAFAVSTLHRHFPQDRAKPRLGPPGRHSHRRWRIRLPAARQGSHAAPRHRPSPRAVVDRRTEVSQPPETAGIT